MVALQVFHFGRVDFHFGVHMMQRIQLDVVTAMLLTSNCVLLLMHQHLRSDRGELVCVGFT